MSVERNVGEGMLFRMSLGKHESFLKILNISLFLNFHEQFNFGSTDPPVLKIPRLFTWFNGYIYVE